MFNFLAFFCFWFGSSQFLSFYELGVGQKNREGEMLT